MASPNLNTVLSTLKACVISNPDGVDEDRLNLEFRQLMGCNIPWKDLGFRSLQELVKTSPSLQVVTRGGRRVVVAETNSVEHLSSMIAKQKKTSTKKRTPRLTRFFQSKMGAYNQPTRFRGGGGGASRGPPPMNNKSSLRRIDFVEKNNNTNKKPPPGPKEIHHHQNARPAGDSSSSGSSSPINISPPKTQNVNQNSIKNRSSESKRGNTKSKETKPPAPKTQPSKKNVAKPKVDKITENIKIEVKPSIEKIEVIKTKRVVTIVPPPPKDLPVEIPSPQTPPTTPTLHVVMNTSTNQLPSAAISNMFTRHPQRLMNTVPDLIPPEPVVHFTPPANLTSNFVPDNLVPPKPMKPGSHTRGIKRRVAPKNKLMSIKDDSTPSEGSITAKFINLVKAQEWPEPEYRLLPRTDANNVPVYSCTVRGSYSLDNNETLYSYDYSTIPDEYRDKNASREAVSQKAFEDMSNKIKEAADYIPVTSDMNEMINRVYKMVTDFHNGLWAYKIDGDYKKKYGERLPSKWIHIISDTDILFAEKLADFSYVIRPVLKTNNVVMKSKNLPLSELQYPETETWDIFVTKVVSSNEIWFRFVGPCYSDWLDEVTKEMCEHYMDWSLFVCPSPSVGEVYVYPSSYGAVRVRVISLDSPITATVIHIDHGDIEEVPRSHLCILDINFRKLPPQAIQCRMYDLDDYAGNKLCNAFLIDKVEGMVLVAEIVQTEPLELIMFDTSLDEPVNLNQEVVNAIRTDITRPPTFPQENVVKDGVVTSVWKTGEIYLQFPNEGLTHLNLHLSSLTEMAQDYYLTYPEEVTPDTLYLVQVNNSWLRASVLPPATLINNMVDLLLVDTGDIITSYFKDLVLLSSISMVLCEIPRQALRVRLSGVYIYEGTVDKLQSLIPPMSNALIRVNSLESTPKVELFIRDSKGLISINSTLQFEDNLSNNVHSITLDTSETEFTTIKPAPTPDCGNFFDVYVVSVSNPGNFTVIPRKYIKELTKLQDRLQEFYNSIDPSFHKLRNFSIGQACAVKHSDGQWYRGLIEQIIDRSMSQLMIRFCDFGNFAMISADRLHSLDRKFLNLPALGFNASIADIRPITGDWEFADCIQLQKLMLEKNLVTVIKNKGENKGQISLILQVFDTSSDTDCDIGNLLVEESRAVYD